MKIISKIKDYYDYLQGIYGIDEKLILDRSDFIYETRIPKENDLIRFYICGYIVEGVFKDGYWRYGDELKKYHKKNVFNQNKYENYYFIECDKNRTLRFLKEPFKIVDDNKNPNILLDSPILQQLHASNYNWHSEIELHNNYKPILREYNLSKVFSAETIWLMLYDFLSRDKNIKNLQTDKEKIISFGFDIKTSFRKM